MKQPIERTYSEEPKDLLFDDDYAGPRWTYGLSNRPLGSAQVPAKWIIFSDRPHPKYGHGTVDYSRELTPHEVYAFELELVKVTYPEPLDSLKRELDEAKGDGDDHE